MFIENIKFTTPKIMLLGIFAFLFFKNTYRQQPDLNPANDNAWHTEICQQDEDHID